MRRECRERFPPPPTSKETASQRSRHASRHVRDARAVTHVGIAYPRWRRKRSRHSRRMHTHNFMYLARGPWVRARTALTSNWRCVLSNGELMLILRLTLIQLNTSFRSLIKPVKCIVYSRCGSQCAAIINSQTSQWPVGYLPIIMYNTRSFIVCGQTMGDDVTM